MIAPAAADMPTLAQFIEASIHRPQPPRLRISQTGSDCVRRVYYEATGAERAPDDLVSKLRMAFGSAFDSYVLAGAPADVLEQFQMVPQSAVEITMGGLTIKGSSDAVFFSNDSKHVVDLKVVGGGTWSKVQNAPKQEHAAQTNLYAYGHGADTWSVCYVNRETLQIREHDAQPTDTFKARKDFGLFEEAAYFIAKGEAPPRPYEDYDADDENPAKVAADSFPCFYCPFRATCWPGATPKGSAE